MEIGIVGLGLIGGSLAKAISQNTDNTVYGFDISKPVVHKAMLVNAIEQPLTDELLSQCDIVIVALYPQDTVDYVRSHADLFKKGSIVCDCSGVKRMVCEQLIPLAEEKGFLFVGGHPMAGREHSGFTYAKKSLFNNASHDLHSDQRTDREHGKTEETVYFNRFHQHRNRNTGRTRPQDRLHLSAGSCGIQLPT